MDFTTLLEMAEDINSKNAKHYKYWKQSDAVVEIPKFEGEEEDMNITVYGKYYAGYRGGRREPSEPESMTVVGIVDTVTGQDVNYNFSEDDLERFSEYLMDEYKRSAEM